jgi:hypothetical protein
MITHFTLSKRLAEIFTATLIIFLFFNNIGSAQVVVNLTTPGTGNWTCPPNVSSITVECWGAGGAGGGAAGNPSAGGGGGGGGYVTQTFPVTSGQVINYTIGAGGIAGTGNGNNGGNTTFQTLTAFGGDGGQSSGNGGAGGNGGSALGGTTTDGQNGSNGELTIPLSGSGGNGGNGGNGAAGFTGNANGVAGIAPGGGGSGACKNANAGGPRSGGNGARGQIRITYEIINDNCSGAIALIPSPDENCPTPHTGTTVGATQSQPGCTGTADDDVWYSFTATSTIHQITVSAITINDIVLQFFSGNCTALNSFGCVDNTVGNSQESVIISGLTIGTTYFFRVYSFANNSGQGSFSICITTPPPPPSNDNCANAINVPVNNNTSCTSIINGTTVSATQSLPGCAGFADDDVWYQFTATGTTHQITVTPGTLNDVVFEVYSGNCGGLLSLACVDNTIGTAAESVTINSLIAGNTYFVRVYSFFNGFGQGSFSICVNTPSSVNCIPIIVAAANPETRYIQNVEIVGALTNLSNLNNGFSTSPRGYQDWTALPPAVQARGEGFNVQVNLNAGNAVWRAWIDWNNNGSFEDFGELVFSSNVFQNGTSFGVIIPPSTPPGNYKIRIRAVRHLNYQGTCTPAYNITSCNTLDSQTSGGCRWHFYGETEDYTLTVIQNCDAIIASVIDGERCSSGAVELTASGSTGTTQYRWYDAPSGGNLLATTPTGSWFTDILTSTTTYYVTAFNGSCESLVRRPIRAIIRPEATIDFTPSNPVVCGEDNIVQITAAGDFEEVYLINEPFDSGLGVFTNVHLTSHIASVNDIIRWQHRANTYIPGPPNHTSWLPAIASSLGANNFVMSNFDYPFGTNGNGDRATALLSPLVNSNDFISLQLSFKMFYSHYLPDGNNAIPDYVYVEVSTNNGVSWTIIHTFNYDVGYGTDFETLTFDLNTYVNQPNLRIRFRYVGQWVDGVALDDVQLWGIRPVESAFNYDTTAIDAFTDEEATIPYSPGTPASTIYIRPSLTQLETASFDIPVSIALTNGCEVSTIIPVGNTSKIWRGYQTDSNGNIISPPGIINWDNPEFWRPNGVPTIDNCVIIPNESHIDAQDYQAYAKNLKVTDSGNLILFEDNFLTVKEWVIVEDEGKFEILNNGSLIQIDDVQNSGNITYRRIAENIKGLDYVYWSSPVNGQNVNQLYTAPSQGPKFRWNPIVANTNGTQGNWENANGMTMETARGYIIRGSNSTTMPATDIHTSFFGNPNNGNISRTVQRGAFTGPPYVTPNGSTVTNLDDNFNLLGNPYPSAINALQFMEDNISIIMGNVRLWTHGTDLELNNGTTIVNPFYGSFSYNYNPNDYLIINYLGSTIPNSTAIVKSGQGFFVQMVDGPAGSGSVNFNNQQRANTYANNNFFRIQNNLNNEIEKHRFWLQLTHLDNVSTGTLIGYVEEATFEEDSKFDASTSISNVLGIYSNGNEKVFGIQGRPTSQLLEDSVPLTISSQFSGLHIISLTHFDGDFGSQIPIYLIDKELNLIHNLLYSPYSFHLNTGVHNTRFEIRYQSSTLSLENFEKHSIKVLSNHFLSVVSKSNTIKEIKIHDVLGRLISKKTNINTLEYSFEEIVKSNQTYLIEVIDSTENIFYFKTIY